MCSSDPTGQKNQIRERMRQSRDSLSMREVHAKSRAAGANLWQMIAERRPERIMFYIAFGSEVRTQDCITRSIKSGKTTIVPVCTGDGRGRMLPSRLLDLQSEVEAGRFGILEPKPNYMRPFPPEKIDLIVVPGLAFDESGYRIGYGGGYYDRFLARCPQALSVGLAYEMQILESVSPAAWDIPVHHVITEDRAILCCGG